MKIFVCFLAFLAAAHAGLIHGHSEGISDIGLHGGELELGGHDIALGGAEASFRGALELEAGYGDGYGYGDAGLLADHDDLLLDGAAGNIALDEAAIGAGHGIDELALAGSASLGYAGEYASGYNDWC